jgi:acyl-CoA synthetase (AMP-forming)/AMP-acid ligase II
VIRSPISDIAIPDAPLADYVLEHADRHGDRAALIDGSSGRTVSFSDLRRLVDRCATGLIARGLEPGEVVGLFSPNLPEFAVAFYGIARAGGTCTTANVLLTEQELAGQLRDAGARFLIAAEVLLETASAAAASAGVEEVFAIGGGEAMTSFSQLLTGEGSAPLPRLDAANHVVLLPFSSGTTGLAKGVMLTHRNCVANVAQFQAMRPFTPSDVVVGVLPFFHIYGQTVVMNATLRAGATVVTMPRFDLELYLRLSQDHRATLAYVAPPIVLALARDPLVERYDLSSVRSVLSGAAPLDAELAQACASRVGCEVVQGYGLTEASPVTNCVPLGSTNRPGTIGPLLPNTSARIVDVLTWEDAAPGEAGEMLVRGPQVMRGYLNDPAATDASLSDGWLRTGDVVVADEDGWFTVIDRAKELIKVKGYQVAPAELEALLLTHPGVADCCVIGIPDEESGEVPKAFVVLTRDTSHDEILAHVRERVAPYKRLRAVESIDQIPKSPSGKILRRVLADRARGGQ